MKQPAGRWVLRWHGGVGECSCLGLRQATADRDWDEFARWVQRDGGVGSEMGLSRMVVASRRQDGSLSPLTLSVSLRTLTLCLAYGFLFFFFSIRFLVWFWTTGLVGLLFFLFLTFTWAGRLSGMVQDFWRGAQAKKKKGGGRAPLHPHLGLSLDPTQFVELGWFLEVDGLG